MKRIVVVSLVVLLIAMSIGCATKTKTGALIGSGAGAALGAVIGKQAGNTAAGAIIGAAVGGATGAAIGRYMDNQAKELDQELAGARIERVGEGIKITFDSGILFAVDSAELRPEAQANLTRLAVVLNKYDDTNILIEGHTDSTGSDEYNQQLSERRAQAVAHFLAQQSVASGRFSTIGYGEMQPVADNASDAGRQQNRRVELAIMANEELKKQMEREAAQQG